jgi:titin
MKRISHIGLSIMLILAICAGLITLISENAEAGTPKSGSISGDETWDLAGSPYWIEGDVVVENGVILTIDAGVEVKFNGYYSLYVDGDLNAFGTQPSNIFIGSNQSSPAEGDWDRIQINSTGHAEVNNVTINYGSIGILLESSSYNNITDNTLQGHIGYAIRLISSTNNNILNNTINTNSDDGISLYSSNDNNITDNKISWCRNGINCYLSSDNVITFNTVDNNKESGINLKDSINNSLLNNTVSSNSPYGIRIRNSSNNTLKGNEVFGNTDWFFGSFDGWGISLESSTNSTIAENDIEGNGQGASIEGYGIHLMSSSNISITDNYVRFNGASSLNEGYGIYLTGSTNNNISYNNVIDNKDGICLWSSSNNNTIFDNDITSNDGKGIYHALSSYNNFTTNNIQSNTNRGIYLLESTYNEVFDNNVGNHGNWDGIFLEYSSDNNITHNSISSNMVGMHVKSSSNNSISFNGASFGNSHGFFVEDSSNYNNLSNNDINNNMGYGLYLLSSSYNDIYQNDVFDNENWMSFNEGMGIALMGSHNNNVTDNDVQSNGESSPIEGYGIYIAGNFNNIRDNYVYNNLDGIYLTSTSNNTIVNNDVGLNQNYGIYLRLSSDTDIYNNIIKSNDGDGLHIRQSSNDNEIIANNISNNGLSNSRYGLYFTSSSNNSIYHNNIINNFIQSFDDMDNNQWNDTYPSGGNYWSDWSPITPDLFEGSITPQITGLPDGICDSQYDIDADSVDYYPLKHPFTSLPYAPRNLSAASGDSYVNLTWNPPGSDGGSPITNYRIYRGTTSGGESFLVEIGNILWYNDTSATNGILYYYNVTAVNNVNEGPWSNEASAMAGGPWAPQNLQAVGGDAYVNITWDAPISEGASPITNYRIYRGTTPGGEAFLIEIGNLLFYNDTSVSNNITYYYKVSAVTAVGEGPLSNEAIYLPIGPPTAPQNLQVVSGDKFVYLTWEAPTSDEGSSITNYRIYRGTSSGGEVFLVEIGNVLSFNDTGVTNNITYYYEVRAVNALGPGDVSIEVSDTPIGPPGVPQNLQISSGDSFINITWEAPASDGGSPITNYRIYRGTTSGGETFYIELGTMLYFNDTSVNNNITYYYNVSAVSAVGEGPLTNEVSDTPKGPPTAPQNLLASVGNYFVNITWGVPASDEGSPITNYRIYRGTSPGGESFFIEIGNVQYFNDTTVTNNITYYFKVSAVNSLGEGPQSNEASGTPIGPPLAPQNLQAVAGDGQVVLTWIAPISDSGAAITNYRIHRGLAPDSEILLVEVGNIFIYYDAGLTNGVTYYYKVSAVNSQGEGAQSNEASVTPVAVPSEPINLVATSGDSFINISWNTPASDGGSPVTNYRIYRGAISGGETFLIEMGDVLFYNDTSVTNGITYYYKVSAKNSEGEGPLSIEISDMPTGLPLSPQDLQAYSGDSYVNITWNAPSSDGGDPITNYLIYRGMTPGGEVFLIEIGNLLYFNDTTVTNGITYYYKVQAKNSIGEGSLSNEVSDTPIGFPSPPQNLLTNPGDAQIVLTWMAPASDGGSPITNYLIYRGTTSGGETFLVETGDVLTYTDAGLINGQEYYYTVSAKNTAGESLQSNEASAKPITIPDSPLGLSTDSGSSYINITWSSPVFDGGSPVTNYLIYKGTASGGEIFLLEIGNVLFYNDTTVTNGITYYYKVSAKNAVGEGPLSIEVFDMPTGLPTAPLNLQASPGNGQITLNWNAPDSDGGLAITNYRIYRGTTSGGETFLIEIGAVLFYGFFFMMTWDLQMANLTTTRSVQRMQLARARNPMKQVRLQQAV